MLKTSLRVKILLLFLLVALIPIITASILQLNYFNSITSQSIQQEEIKIVQDCSNQMDLWLEKKASQLNGILKAHPELKQLDKKYAASLLKALYEIDNDMEVPAVVDKDGKGLTIEGNEMDLAQRDYFIEVKSKKVLVISNILLSKVSGKNIIMIAAPIIDENGNFQGALLNPLLITSLEKTVGSIKVKNTGYGTLLTSEGKFIFHPDKDIIGKSLEEYSKNPNFLKAFKEGILSKNTGIETYTDDKGIKKIVAYDKVSATNWSLVVMIPYKEAYEHLNTVFFIFLLTLVGALVFVIVISFFASRFISKPIVEISKLTKKAEKGDFTERLHTKKASDEVGELTGNINHLFDALSSMVSVIRIKSDKLDSSATSLSATSQQIAASSQEVSLAIQETSKGASEQSRDLELISNMLDKFDSELNNIYSLLISVNESTELTEKLSNDGNSTLNELTTSIKEIKQAFEIELKNINELNINIQKIDEITALIKSISDQTNLLALNAAIEAARAGESGKGFAVVADEIRKLAEQSRKSTDGISQIVKTIMSGTQEIVETSIEVDNRLTLQINVVTNTTRSFEGILNSVLESIPKVKQVFNEMNDIVKDKDTIISKVQSLAAVSQETNATAEEVAASTEEMSAATQEITSMAQELQNIAIELNEEVKKFKF